MGSRRRRIRMIALPLVGSALIASLTVSTAAAAPGATYEEYVSLGDSWTADVVLLGVDGRPTSEFVPLDCFQATNNYPKQVAKGLGVERFTDASCGGATTVDFTQPQSGLPLGGTNPAQFDRLTPTTDLVTVGIGGNDAGLAGAVVQCLSVLPVPIPGLGLPSPLGASCKAAFTEGGVDRMSEAIEESEPKVVAALEGVHERSPDADVFLVNYLAGIRGPGCWPYVPMLDVDAVWISEKLQELNAMLVDAAEQADAKVIDTYTPTIGHDVCQLPHVRYAEALIPASVNGPALAVPFHPNSAGANAQSQIVLTAIRGAALDAQEAPAPVRNLVDTVAGGS